MTTANQKEILSAIKDDSVVDLLMREYTILQDKIDKIGGFRFTIKGWALTLDTGAVLATFTTSLDRHLSIALIFLVVFALWLLELKQVHLSNIFQNRTFRIERAIMRRLTSHGLRRGDVASLINVPGIANEIRSPLEQGRLSSPRRRTGLNRWFLDLRPVIWIRRSGLHSNLIDTDLYFYLLIWIFAALFIWFQHATPSHEKHDDPSAQIRRTISASMLSHGFADGGAKWRANQR